MAEWAAAQLPSAPASRWFFFASLSALLIVALHQHGSRSKYTVLQPVVLGSSSSAPGSSTLDRGPTDAALARAAAAHAAGGAVGLQGAGSSSQSSSQGSRQGSSVGGGSEGSTGGLFDASSQHSSSSSSSSQGSSSQGSSSQDTSGDDGLTPMLARYFPAAGLCPAGWARDYAALHADITAGRRPARYLVAVPSEGGLADRLTGIITLFYAALLSRRAFTAAVYAPVWGFDSICDFPRFNWTDPRAWPDAYLDPLKTHYKGLRDGSSAADVNASLVRHLYLTGSHLHGDRLDFLSRDNLTAALGPSGPPDVPFLLATNNRGRTFAMMDNPHHKQALWAAGLNPSNAFGCAFFALCSPSAAVARYYSAYWDALRAPGVLSIGIQVRIGDKVFQHGESEADQARVLAAAVHHFECAEAVERARGAPGQRVVWYLASDSLQLRKAAKAKYGDKLLTDTELATEHPECVVKGGSGAAWSKDPGSCTQAKVEDSLLHAMGCIMTLSLADYHVVSLNSGFGKMGAFLSGRWHNAYAIERAACDPAQPTSLRKLSESWSGVR